MKIKEVDRTANVAWSPAQNSGIYLAAGTAAQQLDSSFSSSAVLELYFFDINQPGLDMPINASLPCESRFHKLIWGSQGMAGTEEADAEYPSGIIVAGCEGGLMQIYDAAKILNNEDPIVFSKTKHTGAVRALDFNRFRLNLLASGASDSEIFIWDLNNPKNLMTPGAKAQPADDVTHLAWNNQVEHILASTFATGCVVWDLRKNEPIIKVADTTSRIRYKVVEWHPTVATQMCLASEDDSSPVIQLWDLRYATSPLKVLQGHQRGVLGLSWCQQDPELLLSCGKDSKIICWNPNYPHPGYEVLCEIPTTSQWSFDVSFCPRNPLVFSASSFDGRISIFGLSGGSQQPVTSSKLADSFPGMDMTISQTPVPAQKPLPVQLRDAPKWLKRPCGASFAFGGKLIKFENVKQTAVQGQQSAPDQRLVTISQVVTLPDFVARSQRLEAALQSGDLGEFCNQKATETSDESESKVWKFLQASFAPNPNHEYLAMLGCNTEEIQAKLAHLVGKADQPLDKEVDELTAGFVSLAQGDSFGNQLTPLDDGGAIFDGISSKSRSESPDRTFSIPTDDTPEGLLNQALLSGNIEYAVDLCLKDGQWADALILASTGPPELIKKAQIKYFQKCQSETSNMVRAIVTRDLKRLVEKCDLECWQQALATALTYADEREFAYLAEILGRRLEGSKDASLRKSSLLCYICCGNLNRLVESWATLKGSADTGDDTPNSLQDVVEQVMILKRAAEARGRGEAITSGPLASKIVEYATLLASQGFLEAALHYLADSNEPSIANLRDRLYYALGRQKPAAKALPRSRQTSESSGGYHGHQRGSISSSSSLLTQKRPSYSSGSVTSQPTMFQPAPLAVNGYGSSNINAFNPVQPSPPLQSQPPQPHNILQPSHSQQQQQPPPPPTSNLLSGNSSLPLPPVSSAAHGWNDPPSISLNPKPKRPPPTQPLDPITHPLFGAAPQQNSAFGGDNYGYGVPPPAPSNTFTPSAPPPSSSFMNSGAGGLLASTTMTSSSSYGGSVPMYPQTFTPAPISSSTFTPGPPLASSGFGVSNQPPSSFNPPPPSTFNPSLPPTSTFTPGPPISTFTPGPPQPTSSAIPSAFTPGPPPPSMSFPPPPSNLSGPLPPSTGFLPGPPLPSQSQSQIPTNPTGLPPLPPSAQPLPQTFTPAVVSPPPSTFTPTPTHFQPNNPAPPASNTSPLGLGKPPAVEAEQIPKGPIPEEHQVVVDTFEKLRSDCYAVAALPQMKRKLEDVARKMEIFCDKLREEALSASTLTALHKIAEAMKNHDYQLALSIHTQLVTAGNFAEISTFLPSIKVLIQSAAQLNVFL